MPVAHAAIQVSLLPALQTVTPGGEFDVRIEVPSSGSAFNAFDVVVGYDPAVLALLPTSPTTLQQGCLFTGVCGPACSGGTIHWFDAAGDSVTATVSMLCNGVSVTGPGAIYKLRFRASNTVQVTTLSIRGKEFFDGGVLVTPVTSTGCQVGIGIALGVPARDAGTLRVQADPNPAFGAVRLTITGAGPGPREVDVLDVSGRTVRHLAGGPAAAGSSLVWNGATDSGARAPAGIYLIRVRSAGQVRHARVAWLP